MNMVVYTLEQRWEILRHYFRNHGNAAEHVRTDFAYGFWKKRSTISSVCSLSCEKCKRNWHPHWLTKVWKAKNSKYTPKYCCCGRKCVWSAININSPSFSTTENFGDIIGLTPYKVQFVQELKPIDHPMRFRFKKIIFSYEAHFDIGG